MNTTINKDLLKNYRFSDKPNAWALEAKSVHHSAEILLQALQTPRQGKLISMPDASHTHMRLKTACYLLSIAIELYLKALYSSTKTAQDQEKTESFGHDVVKLNQKLIAKGVLNNNELDKRLLEAAKVLLEWSGRYHRPNPKEIDRIIETHFEEVPGEPNMVKPKFGINHETAEKIHQIANQLSKKAQVNPSTIDHLIFLPF